MLESVFKELLSTYTSSQELMARFWNEIDSSYTQPDRFYHNLNHLEKLLQQLLKVKSEIKDWETILFTLFYHDVVYVSTNKKNEEESAELAQTRMRELLVNEENVQMCVYQILATKSHVISEESDTNLFTDADLSILGEDWTNYQTYFNQVRKEYQIYPDEIYQAGRKKVLAHLLGMEQIYKTEYFYSQFEKTARANIQKELSLL